MSCSRLRMRHRRSRAPWNSHREQREVNGCVMILGLDNFLAELFVILKAPRRCSVLSLTWLLRHDIFYALLTLTLLFVSRFLSFPRVHEREREKKSQSLTSSTIRCRAMSSYGTNAFSVLRRLIYCVLPSTSIKRTSCIGLIIGSPYASRDKPILVRFTGVLR